MVEPRDPVRKGIRIGGLHDRAAGAQPQDDPVQRRRFFLVPQGPVGRAEIHRQLREPRRGETAAPGKQGEGASADGRRRDEHGGGGRDPERKEPQGGGGSSAGSDGARKGRPPAPENTQRRRRFGEGHRRQREDEAEGEVAAGEAPRIGKRKAPAEPPAKRQDQRAEEAPENADEGRRDRDPDGAAGHGIQPAGAERAADAVVAAEERFLREAQRADGDGAAEDEEQRAGAEQGEHRSQRGGHLRGGASDPGGLPALELAGVSEHGGDFRRRRFRSRAGREPGQNRIRRSAVPELRADFRRRYPCLEARFGEEETGRHDSGHAHRRTVQQDLASLDTGSGPESAPHPVAEKDGPRTPDARFRVIGGGKGTAESRGDSEDLQQARAEAPEADRLRPFVAEKTPGGTPARQGFERGHALADRRLFVDGGQRGDSGERAWIIGKPARFEVDDPRRLAPGQRRPRRRAADRGNRQPRRNGPGEDAATESDAAPVPPEGPPFLASAQDGGLQPPLPPEPTDLHPRPGPAARAAARYPRSGSVPTRMRIHDAPVRCFAS